MKIRNHMQGQSAEKIQASVLGILAACKDNANANGLTAELAVLHSADVTLTTTLAHQRAVQRQTEAARAAADAAVAVVCTAFETLVARTEAQPNMTPEAARRLGFEIAQPNHN